MQTKWCKCKNVLIVDHDVCSLKVLEKMVKIIDREINIITLTDGKYVVNVFKEKNKDNHCKFCDYFKFILIDLNMGFIDGAKATEEIQEIAKRNCFGKGINRTVVKIIGVSPYNDTY